MKKAKRLIALLSSATLMLGMLAGCSNSSSSSSTASSSAGSEQQSSSNVQEKAPTLKWIQISPQPKDLAMVTEEMNKYTEEKINVKCEFTYLDWGVWADRVTAIVNSGEAFDIMFTNGDKFNAGVSLNAFADLTDLLNETPKLKETIPELVWKGVTIKDKIWAVPTYKDSSQTQYWVWDKEIVEKLNIDYKNIKTAAQLDPALHLIQDAINKGEIKGSKYALINIKDGINGFFSNYDSQAGTTSIGVKYNDSSAKVVNVYEQDEIKEALGYMHKWYKEGLINPDATTLTEGPKWIPVGSAQGFPGADVIWASGRGKDVVIQDWSGPIYSTGTILGSVNAIAASSKYKVEALKYLELMNTDNKIRDMFAYGIEGVHFKNNGDGTITFDDVKRPDYSPATYSQATFFNVSPIAPNSADQWTQVKEWNEKAEASVLLGFSFDRSKVETQIANVSAVDQKFMPEILTGAADGEKKIPEYYAALEKAGLNDIRVELQAQIDAWLAAK